MILKTISIKWFPSAQRKLHRPLCTPFNNHFTFSLTVGYHLALLSSSNTVCILFPFSLLITICVHITLLFSVAAIFHLPRNQWAIIRQIEGDQDDYHQVHFPFEPFEAVLFLCADIIHVQLWSKNRRQAKLVKIAFLTPTSISGVCRTGDGP